MTHGIKGKSVATDTQRRDRQAKRFVRIIRVHHELNGRPTTAEIVASIGKTLSVTTRTVYRDIAVLREAYSIIGSTNLDAK